jgi:integrase
MTKSKYNSEQIKRDFFEQLKGARGFAKSSIHVFADSIAQWEKFTKDHDFSNFSKAKASAFVEWLSTRLSKTKSGKIALVTQYNYLRRVKKFFEWLSDQPGYKNKISKNDVNFLRLSKKDARIAQQGTTRRMPVFEDIKTLIESIEIKNEIDKRDRALISLTFITGGRISAVTTLRMKNFDKHEKIINQNPGDGVKTKSSKQISCTFFPIGWDEPEKYFMEWYQYLESKGFQPDDPIFPATLSGFGSRKSNPAKDIISKNFWGNAGSARNIFRKRFGEANLPYFHPHSFRHLIVSIVSKNRLTEEEKKAISLNLGHEDVATTFGSYGYGGMTPGESIKIVKELGNPKENLSGSMTEEERAVLENFLKRNR